MEEIKKRYEQLLQAYERLTYMAETYKQLSGKSVASLHSREENELITHRDALIQRFQFCYELIWKFLKILLRDKFLLEVANPRLVFQEYTRQDILTSGESDMLLEMARARNEIVHIYDENIVEALGRNIVVYNEFLNRLALKLKPT